MKYLHALYEWWHGPAEPNEPWQIKAARFCVEKKSFRSTDLETYIESIGLSHDHAHQFYMETIYKPVGREHSRNPDSEGKWAASVEVVTIVTDYDELRFARRAAQEARKWAIAALIVSSLALLAQTAQLFFSV